METNNLLQSFDEAWNMLLDIPLPLKLNSEDADEDEIHENLILCFPLVGAVLGLCAYLTAWLTGLILHLPLAAALIASLLIGLGTELVSASSNISLLTFYIKSIIDKAPVSEYHSSGRSALSLDSPISMILFLSLYLIKLFCIGLLIYYTRSSWLIVVFTLSYLIRSQLALEREHGSSLPLIAIEDENKAQKLPWIITTVIVIIAGSSSMPAAILILPAVFGLIILLKKLSEAQNGISPEMIGVYGAASELLLLFICTAILIK